MALTNGNIKALLTIHEAEFITTPPTVILALIFDFCVKTRFISILQSTPESIAIIDKKNPALYLCVCSTRFLHSLHHVKRPLKLPTYDLKPFNRPGNFRILQINHTYFYLTVSGWQRASV